MTPQKTHSMWEMKQGKEIRIKNIEWKYSKGGVGLEKIKKDVVSDVYPIFQCLHFHLHLF